MVERTVFFNSIGPHLGHVTFGDMERDTRAGSVLSIEADSTDGEWGRPNMSLGGIYLNGGCRKG